MPDLASISVPDTLAELHVGTETGLTIAEVNVRRKQHGYNEVAETKSHPFLTFLTKFWGVSAWMLELIMVLSAVLGKYSDLAVVGALLVVNAVLGFMQEHRAAGVVNALRRRLQVNARVLREAIWQVIAARELVPALQPAGHVTGMTGDGVNDAPALRRAEVGIAVSARAEGVFVTDGAGVGGEAQDSLSARTAGEGARVVTSSVPRQRDALHSGVVRAG